MDVNSPARVSIINVGYRSTNYWVVSAGRSRVLVDLGWPGSIGTMKANLKRADVPLPELRYAIATHYHIDHAGVAQDLKRLGVPLLVIDTQVPAIAVMKTHTKPQDHYTDITPVLQFSEVVVAIAESRKRLADIGIAGAIVATPGHSDDSVTLVLDEGAAFTGDLTPLSMAEAEHADTLAASWQKLRDLGATTIYPGHGPVRPLSR